MENLDFSWLLIALPAAFALGWVASRIDLRQWKRVQHASPAPFFKGLNHLLNAQEDEAIDAFILTAQQDPRAIELHFALGNLFRNRGDHDRAIRVYEHLLQRPDLPESERQRARHALAQAFLRAGILDRAEEQLNQLTGTPFHEEALLALLGLYERTSEWPKALAVAERLQTDSQLDFSSRMAHYRCEMAQARPERSMEERHSLLVQALTHSPWHVRTHLELAHISWEAQQHQDTMDRLMALVRSVPNALPLAAPRLVDAATRVGQVAQLTDFLRTAQNQTPGLDVLQALLRLVPESATDVRHGLLMAHLQREPSLVVATEWLLGTGLVGSQVAIPNEVRNALQRACAPLQRYRCAACGFETTRHFWQCPGCQTWDSYPLHRVEEL